MSKEILKHLCLTLEDVIALEDFLWKRGSDWLEAYDRKAKEGTSTSEDLERYCRYDNAALKLTRIREHMETEQ